jgi:hypothetical protein
LQLQFLTEPPRDIVELADSYGLTVRAAARSDMAPDEAIVKELPVAGTI